MRKVTLILTICILWLPGISEAVVAPPLFPPKLRADVEVFIDVYDAVFDAKRTRSKKALRLWDSLVAQRGYKEINLARPFEYWNFQQARKRKKDYIELAHKQLAKGAIDSPREALIQKSKIDGYRLGTGGNLYVYTRYLRTYNGKNHFGFAIFKIKKPRAPLSIKKWNAPPYSSNWKIIDVRWKPITQPKYNKRVFQGYPIVDW